MTDLPNHIQDLITATKAMPNSLERNKIVSHLEDAKAHAIALDHRLDKAPPPTDADAPKGDPFQLRRGPQKSCICPNGEMGPYEANCPVHGL